MFLKLIRRAKSGGRNDQGFALITVMAVMAVLIIMTATIGAVSVSSTGFTTSTGALNQSKAAADTAIDSGRVAMTAGSFYCTLPQVTGYSFTATVKYYDKNNAALPCGATVVGQPVSAVITATGYANHKGVAGISNGDSYTRISIVTIAITSNTVALDKAVFTDGSWTMTNGTTLVGAGADVYSNGDVTCATSNTGIAGNVYIQGSLTIPNNCVVKGTAWAGAAVIDVQGTVGGDLFGVQSVKIENDGFVGGSVASNGNVSIDGNSKACPVSGGSVKVCGSVVSFGGGVALNGRAIAGGVYAYGSVDLGSTVNSTKVVGKDLVSINGPVSAGNVSGVAVGGYLATGGLVQNASNQLARTHVTGGASSCAASVTTTTATLTYPQCSPLKPVIPVSAVPAALNYPTNPNVVAPPRQSLPRLMMEPTGLAARWAGWTIQNVTCEASVKSAMQAQAAGSSLLLVSSCGSQMTWDSINTPVRGNLAIMAPKAIKNQNSLTIASANSANHYDFMWIVPSDSAGVTWTQPVASDPTYYKPTCSGVPDIGLNNATLGAGLSWFIYTPCTIAYANGLAGFNGQMYSGNVTGSINNMTITMTKMNVPGVTGMTAASASITVTETARFDKRG